MAVTAVDVLDFLRLAWRRTEEEFPWRAHELDEVLRAGDPAAARAVLERNLETWAWQVAAALNGQTDDELDRALRESREARVRAGWKPPAPAPRPDPPPPAPGPAPGPAAPARPPGIVGRLRVQTVRGRRVFTDDTGSILPVACHAGEDFSLFVRDRRAWEADQLELVDAGFYARRTWITLNNANRSDSFWAGRGVSPLYTRRYDEQLREYVEASKTYGIKLHLAAGDLQALSDRDESALFGLVADVLDVPELRDWVYLTEGLNEARDTGDPDDVDPRELERLVNLVRHRHPNHLYALTAYTGHEDWKLIERYTPRWMRVVLYHAYRGGHWYDKYRHLFSMAWEVVPKIHGGAFKGVPIVSGEPFGWGKWVSATQHMHELDDEAMAGAAAQALVSGQLWTFFSSAGVIADEPFARMHGFRQTMPLVRRLPRELMTWDLMHAGTSQPRRVLDAVDAHDLRFDHRLGPDGELVGVIYGRGGRRRMPVRRAFRGTLIDPDGTAPDVAVTKRAGDELEVEFRRSRVLVGQLE